MADDTFYGFRVVTNPAIPEGVIYTRTGVIETLAQEVERLRAENAAMRPIVAAFVQEDGTPTQTIDYDGPVGALCNFCEGGIREKAGYVKFEHNNGDVSWHEPNCPAVVAVGLMEGMKE